MCVAYIYLFVLCKRKEKTGREASHTALVSSATGRDESRRDASHSLTRFTNPRTLARRPAMVAATVASTSTAAAYSSLAPNPTARDPVRRRTTHPLVAATNRHVHGRTVTSLRQIHPRDHFANPPRPLFVASAAKAKAEEMAAEASSPAPAEASAKPFAVLFVCLGKSREPYSIPTPGRASVSPQLIRVACLNTRLVSLLSNACACEHLCTPFAACVY